MTGAYVASIDQGSASSRCMLFDQRGRLVSMAQKEHRQLFPRPGWVEQDGEEILGNVLEVVGDALDFLMELRMDEGPLGEEEAGRRLDAWWAARQSS